MLRALRWIPSLFRDRPAAGAPPVLDLRAVHAEHARHVWVSLQRLGVRRSDLADVHQDVFVILHERLHTYDGRVPLAAWIFGICRRKAASYRRRAWLRRVEPKGAFDDLTDESADPESRAELSQARAALDAILDDLDVDKRAVFVMFELEGLPCEEIAATMGVPIGTVYSRLHAARKLVEKAARRRTRDSMFPWSGPRLVKSNEGGAP